MTWAYRYYSGRIRRQMRLKRRDRALRLAKHYVHFFPDDPSSWDALGIQLGEVRDYDGAEEAYRRGAERFPDSWLTYQLAIAMMIELRKLPEARSLLEEFKERRPDSPLPYLGLGHLARTEEDWATARSFALKALRLATPNDRRTRMHIAPLLLQISSTQAQARQLLEELTQEKGEPVPHLYLAVLLESSAPEESEAHLRAASTMMKMPYETLRAELDPLRSLLPE